MNDDLLGRVLAWCGDDPRLQAGPLESGSGRGLTVQSAKGTCRVAYGVDRPARLVLVRQVALRREQQANMAYAGVVRLEDLSQAIDNLVAARSSLVVCSAGQVATGWVLQISHPVYVDGLTQHSFFAALTEVERFATILNSWLDGLATVAQLQRETEQAVGHAQQALATVPERAPAPSVASPATTGDGRLCEGCRAPIPAGSAFCVQCGRPAKAATPVPSETPGFYTPSAPRRGPVAANRGATCARCGAQLTAGSRFCTGCGAPAA